MTISGPAEAVTGGEYKLKLNVNPSASDKSVVWYSSDAYTATVGADNVLRIAPDAFPYTEVTLTAVSLYNNACAATHTVTIIPGAQRIDVRGGNGASDSIELWLDPANKTTKVSASVYPADAQQNVTWKTTNKKIATVNAEGVLTAKAAGTAYVYAVAEDGTEVESERIKVIVKKAPKSVKFTSKTAVLGYDAENGSAMSSQLKVTLSSGSASTIKYKSLKPDVVHVDENGVITAKTTGTAKITASTYNKKSATCTVTVKKAPESISIGAQDVVVAVSDGYTFKPQIPSGSVADWTFDSSNKSVATVDGNGVLTPVSVGETVVTVTAFNGRQDNCTVKVVPDPDGVILKNGDIVLGKGESCYLKPEAVLEGDGETAASFTYKSSSSRVKVGKDGKITASATGTAVITVTTHNDRSVQCTVTVRKAPASVKIIPAKVTLAYDEQLGLGTSEQLAVRLSSGSASKITFTSSNEKAVKVDENGVVKAVGLGQAKITAKAFNGKKATCTVTVRLAPVNMVFDRPVYDVAVNDVITVSAHANEGCHAPGAAYAVRDGNSASIDSVTGLVTPLAIGETIITATAFNGAAGEAVINVVAAPDNITLNAGKITLKVGKKFTIRPEVSRADKAPTAASFTYKSSKSSVASVSSSGVITAKKKGTAVITVTTHNGFEAKITVKVK